MNINRDNWDQRNEQYLAAALNWLRLKLEKLAISINGNNRKSKTITNSVRSEAITQAVDQMNRVASVNPPPALVLLSKRFGLSPFEQEILLLCAAMELDTRIPGLCARVQDDPNMRFPTFALCLALFDCPAWDVLSPERPLRRWRLMEINQYGTGTQSLVNSPLQADQRIVDYLKGLNYLDHRLIPLLAPFDVVGSRDDLSTSQLAVVDSITRHLKSTINGDLSPVIHLVGTDSISKQLAAQCAATRMGIKLRRLPAELLPQQATELDLFARLWQRENLLLPIALYIDAHEPETVEKNDTGRQPVSLPLNRFLARANGIFFLSSRENRSKMGPSTYTVEIAKPAPTEQKSVWTELVGKTVPGSPALLAAQFNLNVPTMKRIVAEVSGEVDVTGKTYEGTVPGNNGRISHECLWNACLVNAAPKLGMLAQRLEPKATWDDLVLPDESMELLRRIADQVVQRSKVYDEWGFRKKMNRGLGINALFTGDSGTGKTMAAEVIANHLRLNLFRIDLSGVVSKYIGETEKNLRRLFDAAEDGGVILFFDEADALFGKRSEVKDSHDRYANIEINYLLQRMESYNGLAILATNMRSALDEAFLRRLRFIVNFPFPGHKERKQILEKVFPADMPRDSIDYHRLARLNLTGGSINNVAVNAAFMAAQDGGMVTMPMILEAAKTEFRKLERPIKEADFRWEEFDGRIS